jgi:hypothetical protein
MILLRLDNRLPIKKLDYLSPWCMFPKGEQISDK